MALLPDLGVIALDFDNCVTDGKVDPEVLDLVSGTYAELSPSGLGLRAVFTGAAELVGNRKSKATADRFGLEVFSSSGFVTFTGWALDHVDLLGLEDRVAPVPQSVVEFCRRRFGESTAPAVTDDFTWGYEPVLGLSLTEIQEALDAIDPDVSRDEWIRIGFALHHERPDDGFDLWNSWSWNGAKYPGEEALRQQWDSFERRKGPGRRQVTMASVLAMARDKRQTRPITPAAEKSLVAAISATPYGWPNPASIPRRQWLFGRWLLRGEVTAIFAPGGVGKSTLSAAIAVSLASGRKVLDVAPKEPVGAWVYNLEDAPDELDRQIAATCLLHGVEREDCGDRLFVNSGITMPLCTASEPSGVPEVNEVAFTQLTATVRREGIGVVIIDPLVSSHRVTEASNEAMDAIVKRWKRLAHETGCAVVLVHHTRKLMGRDATAEDGRGASALRDAARVVLVLNKVSTSDAKALGLSDHEVWRSLVKVDMGKASRSPDAGATWLKLEGQSLGNGNDLALPDIVGVVTLFDKPDVFAGLSTGHLYRVQQRLSERDWRENVQAKDWAGHLVADVIGLNSTTDEGKIKAILKGWKRTGAIVVEHRSDAKGKERPCLAVGKPANPSEIAHPHHARCSGEGEESGGA